MEAAIRPSPIFLRGVRPAEAERGYEVRFETPPREQAQVDFAHFHVVFTDEPTLPRIAWLFSLVLGFSRPIRRRFVVHQDLPTVLRCHAGAFEALGGAPREVLYDRMKTAVIGEGDAGIVSGSALKMASLPGARCQADARSKKKWNDLARVTSLQIGYHQA